MRLCSGNVWTANRYATAATFRGDFVVLLIPDSIQESTRQRKSIMWNFINFSKVFYKADIFNFAAVNFMFL
jgi:hypothetical protein